MADCPSCKTRLHWWNLQDVFSCPACGTELAAQTGMPLAITITLWIVLDVPVKGLLFETIENDDWLAVVIRIVVSCAMGFAIAHTIIGQSKVSERESGE